MRKPSKQIREWQAAFRSAIRGYLDTVGVREMPGGSYPLVVDTVVGELQIAIYENWVVCRFADMERTKPALGRRINPFTGKWNFHFSYDCEVGDCLQQFQSELSPLIR